MPERPSRALVRGSRQDPLVEYEAPYMSEPAGLDGREVLSMFRRNWWIVLATTVVALVIAAFLVSREVQTYTATAAIRLVDRTGDEEGSSSAPKAIGASADPLLSEIMVLQGRPVIEKAVDQGGLRIFSKATDGPATIIEPVGVEVPADEKVGSIELAFGEQTFEYEYRGTRGSASYGDTVAVAGVRFVVPSRPGESSAELSVVPRAVAVSKLMGKVKGKSRSGTSLIDVSFTSTHPSVATRAVNEIVEAYQVVNADLARQGIRKRRDFVEQQLGMTDSLLANAQAGLSGHRSAELAYSAKDRFAAEQSNLISVELQQAEMQANLQMYETLLNRILEARDSNDPERWNALAALPGMSSLVTGLHGQLVSHLDERESLLAGPWAKAPTHPDVQRLDSLINSVQERLVSAVQSHIAAIRAQIAALGRIRGRSAAKMSDLPRTEVEEMYLTQNVSALEQTADMLRDEYYAIRLEEVGEMGQVEIVEPAKTAIPSTSSRGMIMALGLLAGLMVGAALVVGKEKLTSSIHGPEEIENMLLVPNLAVIPKTSPRTLLARSRMNGKQEKGVAKRGEPVQTLLGAEAFRVLRTNLLYSGQELRTLVIASAAPGEGKTMTAVNLSAAFARQGLRVLLIECDLRRPNLAEYFESVNGGGLSSVLEEDRPWRAAVQPSGLKGLDLLVAGRVNSSPSESLSSPAMKRLLEEAADSYDRVIIDSSPLLMAADASILGAICDGVLLVVRTTRTDRVAVQRAIQQLSMVGARVVGTVLNDPDGELDRSESYYGTYYGKAPAYEE